MKKISQLFLQGLFAVLPLAITLSVLYWLGATAEAALGDLLKWFLPQGWYWRGMGLVAGFFVILGIGVLLNAYIFRKFAELIDHVFEKIPLVKTLYNSIRDIARFASPSQHEQDLKQVVSITIDKDIRMIGFITRHSMSLAGDDNLVAVYFPLSYQIGGYTLFLPQSRLQLLDMSIQEAMHLILTAAITKPDS